MIFLGIDYGNNKIGLAVGDTDSKFAQPLTVVRYIDEEKAIEKISNYAKIERAEKLILGISEGLTAQKTEDFGRKLKNSIKLPVVYHDETLTTHEAQELSKNAGIKRKKRREGEDSYAASLILQNYLELNY